MSKHHYKTSEISPVMRLWRVLLLGTAFVVRILSIQMQGLWRDEVDQWRFALEAWSVLWGRFTQTGWNGPLFSPLLRVWIALTGESVFAMRYFSLLCGVLSVALLYVLGKHLLDEKVAFLSAVLMAFSPYMIWYAQEIKMYTWIVMLVLLALYALCHAGHRAGYGHQLRWWLLLAGVCLVLFYSHVLGPLLVPVLGVWFIYFYRHKPKVWVWLLIVGVCISVLAFPLLRWQWQIVWLSRETGYPRYTFGEMVGTLLNAWCAGIYQGGLLGGNLALYSIVLFVLVGLVGVVTLFVRRRVGVFILLLVWLGIPLGALWAISINSPIFTDRYLIWCAPAWYLLIAVGISGLGQVEKWFIPALLAGLLVLDSLGLYAQTHHPIKPEFPQAVAYLREHHTSETLLVFQIPYNHHVVDYYAPDLLVAWAEAPFTNWRLEDGSYQIGEGYVNEQLRSSIGVYEDVWLVYSEVEMWDDRDLVRAWFDVNAHLVDMKAYFGVTLYRYTVDSSP